MKQTAVEWLVQQLWNEGYFPYGVPEDIVKKAKEMEKEQIMDAYRINPNNENWSNSGIDYYNETFKSK
jgi:hypothetical protein